MFVATNGYYLYALSREQSTLLIKEIKLNICIYCEYKTIIIDNCDRSWIFVVNSVFVGLE